MSVFRNNVITALATDQIGFGATLAADGSVSAITGATMRYVTAAPTAADNAGSLALRSNGTLYMTAGGGTWFAIGGVAAGWNLPDNIAGIWGTTAPMQASSLYVSASNRFELNTANVSSAAGGSVSAGQRYATGSLTVTGPVAGTGSGGFAWVTGDTDVTDGGGTMATGSGGYSWTSGASASTLGATSGSTGGFAWTSGNSTDLNSGGFTFTSGTAGGTRGIKLNGIRPEVVELGNGLSASDCLVHDERDPFLAAIIMRMDYPAFPVPMGVLYRNPRPTYEVLANEQIAQAKAEQRRAMAVAEEQETALVSNGKPSRPHRR